MNDLLILGTLALIALVSVISIIAIKHCHLPRRKPKVMDKAALALAGIAAAMNCQVRAGEPAKPNLLDKVSIAAVGAHQQADFAHGPGQWGAGLDAGLSLHRFVSLHLRNLAFEQNEWRGSVVDETSLYGRADWRPLKSDKFHLYGTGGGTRHWTDEDWSLALGAGAEYRFNKTVALSAAREIRAHFKGQRDWLTTVTLRWTF
jgi:hypothetical protein